LEHTVQNTSNVSIFDADLLQRNKNSQFENVRILVVTISPFSSSN